MTQWTDNAEQAFLDHLARTRARVEASGADPDEVAEDLRRHINEEAAASGLAAITREDVARILGRMGLATPEPATTVPPPRSAPQHPRQTAQTSFGGGKACVCVLFGVILPAFTLAFEYFTGMCNAALFDPIPSAAHIFLVALVPVANVAVVVALTSKSVKSMRLLGWMNAIGIGVALYFALIFLPFLPIAILGILAFGLGFLPMSPLLSFIVALSLRPPLKRAAATRLMPVWKGILIAFAAFVLLDVPKLMTQIGMHMAASTNPQSSVIGIRMLRVAGSRDTLLRHCYVGNRFAADVVSAACSLFAQPVPTETVRDIYYRVTGTPFNAVKPPKITGLRGGMLVEDDEWDFDQGGDAVASRIRGLGLAESRIDGKVNADDGWAYTEWTLVFRNEAQREHEARAEITLPPGAVVSRLNLWINGEEREAAFGTRDQVKTAYKQVVQRRRDPVLVTTCGKDRILMQCYPVPARGGTMKVRIGITAPLDLESKSAGVIELPRFSRCNFDVPSSLAHAVWFEAHSPLAPVGQVAGIAAEHPSVNLYGTRGTLNDAALNEGVALSATRNAAVTDMWVPDMKAASNRIVHQTVVSAQEAPPQRIAVVIDGSRRMKPYYSAVTNMLACLPAGIETSILLAGDNVANMRATDAITFVGGCDNVPALGQAWDQCASAPTSAIIWLHAVQPMELSRTEALEQRWERRPNGPMLYDVQFGGGPNMVAAKLDRLATVRHVNGSGSTAHSMAQVSKEWQGQSTRYGFKRWSEPADKTEPKGKRVDTHIARLWANEHACTLGASWKNSERAEAAHLSREHQIVTPSSGAVVLETAQQYADAGLQPVEEDSSPHVVPEPVGGLIVIGYWLFVIRRRRGGYGVQR